MLPFVSVCLSLLLRGDYKYCGWYQYFPWYQMDLFAETCLFLPFIYKLDLSSIVSKYTKLGGMSPFHSLDTLLGVGQSI